MDESSRRGKKRPRSGGYDCEFVEKPQEAFQSDCPVCLLVLRDPHQLTCCGNSICEACLKPLQEDKKPCPTCKQHDFTFFEDKRLKRSLNQFQVYCSHKEDGCDWVGELGELDNHLNLQPPPDKQLEGCNFSEIECSHCSESFQRRYVGVHQSDECPKRPYTCQHCRQYCSTYDDVMQKHLATCGSFYLSCPNNCGVMIQNQELRRHISQDCPLTVIPCDFSVAGCQVSLVREKMPAHISENVVMHTSRMLKLLYSQRKAAKYTKEKIGKLHDTLVAQAKTIQEMKSTIALQKAMIDTSDKEVQNLHSIISDQGKTILRLQQTLPIKDTDISPENPHIVATFPVEFTMTGFEEHKKNSDVWYSPPFYTHASGYKLCIAVHANGYGAATGTHVTVGLRVMRGEFDDEVQWPFQGAITIQLLNQLMDSSHFLVTIDALSGTNPFSFGRVVSGDKSETGMCVTKFIPHTQLDFSSDMRCQYLKDNKLKFRVFKVANTGPIMQLHRRCSKLECQLESVETKMSVVPVTFTLTDFLCHKRHKAVWLSPAFYSHPQGYRMCLQVYPNGCGKGTLNHVSVYNCIMPGAFDAHLQWPFRGEVTLQILNRLEDDKHVQYVVPYTDTVTDLIAGRVTDGERASGWGRATFIPHNSLGLNSEANTQYLMHDSLRIQVLKVRCMATTTEIEV